MAKEGWLSLGRKFQETQVGIMTARNAKAIRPIGLRIEVIVYIYIYTYMYIDIHFFCFFLGEGGGGSSRKVVNHVRQESPI